MKWTWHPGEKWDPAMGINPNSFLDTERDVLHLKRPLPKQESRFGKRERAFWLLLSLLLLAFDVKTYRDSAPPVVVPAESITDRIDRCERLSAQLVAAIGRVDPDNAWSHGLIANASDRYNR